MCRGSFLIVRDFGVDTLYCQKVKYRWLWVASGSEGTVDGLHLDRENDRQRAVDWAPRLHERRSMRFKNMSGLAALAVGVGFSGFMATGCGDLNIGPPLRNVDSVPTPGFDDPNSPGDANIVPIEESGVELEGLAR